MLIKRQLDSKNQFATNTIRFIDSTLVAMESQLRETGDELKSFQQDKRWQMLKMAALSTLKKISDYDMQRTK
jgi:hypothetical protein